MKVKPRHSMMPATQATVLPMIDSVRIGRRNIPAPYEMPSPLRFAPCYIFFLAPFRKRSGIIFRRDSYAFVWDLAHLLHVFLFHIPNDFRILLDRIGPYTALKLICTFRKGAKHWGLFHTIWYGDSGTRLRTQRPKAPR